MFYTINNVNLVGGNLTRDAELSYTNNGNALCKFSIAMNRSVKQGDTWEERTDFFKVLYWGKPAEGIAKFLTKGKKVAVSGRLSQNRWQSPEGKNMSSVEVVANDVILMGGKPEGQEQQNFDDNYNQGYQQPPQMGEPMRDEEVPF